MGQAGENQAVLFLQTKNYQILDRNYRAGHGEIDIIALDPQTQEVIFVEVKTRTHEYYGDPSLAVNHLKLRSLIKVAVAWLKQKKRTNDFRFDIVTVTPQKIEHYVNITW